MFDKGLSIEIVWGRVKLWGFLETVNVSWFLLHTHDMWVSHSYSSRGKLSLERIIEPM